MEECIDKKTYGEIAELITTDKKIISNLKMCFESPMEYLEENIDRYDERGVDEFDGIDTVVWIGIADELIENGYAVELDWSEGLDEFLSQIKVLADKNNLKLEEDWFDEDENIPVWCDNLDEKWAESGFCVGAMDIDSDSYVMFICKVDTLDKLIELGEKVEQRFDFAKNM